ncbi:MAG: serine hydrolase [Bacteroidota bacterium]
MKVKFLRIACVAPFLLSCVHQPAQNPLLHALNTDRVPIKKVMDSLDQFEVQIKYTQIDKKKDTIVFTDYNFQVDQNRYFYPASTVKFPAAVATLEKLNEIDTLTRNTRFYVEGDSIETTFAKAISEIFAVSDNEANNRLVEFLGFDQLNSKMKARGIAPIRIAHRLSTANADDVTTKPLVMYLNDSTTSITAPIVSTVVKALELEGTLKGKGYLDEDTLVMAPFNFGLKNYYPIDAQHALMKRIVFPEKFPEQERFNLTEEQHDFLLESMHTLPKNAGYDNQEYYDSYGKFFMYGDSENPIPDHIKIYNKVGYAYGTLTDCAYIKDEKNMVEFLLTATILVNQNGIFNDNVYEYDDIGVPFLAQLGRELYEYELKRK